MGENLHSHAEDLERIEESDFWSKVKAKLVLKLVKAKISWMLAAGQDVYPKH